MSTPETRAIQWLQLSFGGLPQNRLPPAVVLVGERPRIRYGSGPRPPTGGVGSLRTADPGSAYEHVLRRAKFCGCRRCGRASALALLVARVFADDHDPAVTADHPALVADLLDARLDLHW